MIYRIDVQVTVPVNPTEVTDRVRDAITNLFPEAEIESSAASKTPRGEGGETAEAPGELLATAHSMDHFSEQLHKQAILDTARGAFFSGQEGDTFAFDLKKQAAFQGVVNFAVGNPGELGDIHVRVRVNEPTVEEFVDHIAPPTEDGKPIQ